MNRYVHRITSIALSTTLLFSMITPGFASTSNTSTAIKTTVVQPQVPNKTSFKDKLKAMLDQLHAQEKNRPTANAKSLASANKTSTNVTGTSDKPRKSARPVEQTAKRLGIPLQKSDKTKAVAAKATFGKISTASAAAYAPDELIVKYKPGVDQNKIRKVYSLKSTKKFNSIGSELVKLPKGTSVSTMMQKMKKDPTILSVQPNYKYRLTDIPNDAYFSELWGLNNTGQPILGNLGAPDVDINAPEAWNITKGSPSVVAAVIDTGIDFSHPDLQQAAWVNPGEIPGDGIDNDQNGYVDDVNGWDFYYNDNTLFHPNDGGYSDSDYHGTHVAGTIAAASNNEIGVAGIAPNVKIMSLKFIGPDGFGSTSNAISAIEYAKQMGATLANNSWGGGGYDPALKEAIDSFGKLFVCAAGNDGKNTDLSPTYPACYDSSNIISVAALTNWGWLAGFSNYGVNTVDVAAPGHLIKSTLPGNSYDYYSGTSMATPHVTGTAALLYSQNPGLSATDVINRLKNTGTPLGSLQGYVGSGRMINAYNALTNSGPISDNDIPGVPFKDAFVEENLTEQSDTDDVYSVYLEQGQPFSINLSGQSGTDFDLYLYSPYATTVNNSEGMLAFSENVASSEESIKYTAPESGVYYIDVYTYKGTGSYYLYTGNGPGVYEDTSSQLQYSGPWANLSGAYSNGTAKQINARGSVELTFVGSRFEWIGMKNSNQGIANVYLDGKLVGSPSLYSSTTATQQKVFQYATRPGKHNVKIEWTGKCDPSGRKSGTNINIDALVASWDNVPPSAPTMETVFYEPFMHAAGVYWTASNIEDLQGFHVYRRLKGETNFAKLTTVPVVDTYFYDAKAVPGNVYEYAVSAVDYSKNESDKSKPFEFACDDNIPGFPMKTSSVTGYLDDVNFNSTDFSDVWSIDLDANKTYSFGLKGADGTDFDLALFGPDAKDVFNDNILRSGGTFGSEEYFSYPVNQSGKYYIWVVGFSGSGNYTLTVNSKPTVYDDDIPGVPLQNNKASDMVDKLDADDVYAISLSAGDTINAQMSTCTKNPDHTMGLYLFPPQSTTVNPELPGYIPNVAGAYGDYDTQSISFSYTVPTTGVYYLDVNGSYSFGGTPYDLAVDILDNLPPVISTVSPANGATVGGQLTISGTANDNKVVSSVKVACSFNTQSGTVTKNIEIPNANTTNTFNFSTIVNLKNEGAVDGSVTTVDLYAVDAKGNTSQHVTRTYTYKAPTIKRVEESAATISGTWTAVTGTSYSGSSAKYATTTGAYAQYTFTGTGIRWIGYKNNTMGYADVYIDGTKVASNVDLYSSTAAYQQTLYENLSLPNTSHTIKIVRNGTKNASSTNSYINLDAFDVITDLSVAQKTNLKQQKIEQLTNLETVQTPETPTDKTKIEQGNQQEASQQNNQNNTQTPVTPSSSTQEQSSNPQTSSSNTQAPSSNPQTPNSNTQTPAADPQTPSSDVEAPATNPQTLNPDAQAPTPEPQTPSSDTQTPSSNSQTASSDIQSTTVNP
ncbi:S8 family serine peptidase [Heliobacterium chlorum]|uniref:S8 family serine peptidase n=1 Tax=Heliobacterium chlorum TaxID=2698 RepID=A0ABR7T2C0_HELCL|nr:S8 family serine peptidase [Heliobacterium chlorum]MBC9784485.1 S8 family serine peptidase [Heliobacterium chlorum]